MIRHPLPPPESQAYLSMTPRTDSPPSQHDSLPRIINTAYSPEPSPIRLTTAPRRPDRSPERTPSFSGSATLNDLTEMLGGAIDAIGLIDSRDTPPPTVIEPKRDKPDLRLGPLAPAAEVMHDGPITPSSLPVRNMSLEGPSASRPPPIRTLSSSQNDCLTKFGSPTLVKSPQRKSATLVNVASRPWPASMLYGHIKTMKNPGDRAKGYARSINDLAKAETGLREWCAASGMLFFAMTRISSCHAASQVHRPVGRAPSKMSNVPSHGVRSQSFLFQTSQASLTIPGPSTHRRQVSASSEFPMRADSYTAREISQRVIDPADQPTSLPPNLPYPQLQQQFQSGMKQSQSMQSVASGASKKGGFFSHMGRRGGKKESVSLGPPGPAAKKDVRGLAISEPRSTSPHGSIDSNGLAAPRVQPSISAPMGPRGPRMGSYTPPPSTNLDRSSTEMVSGRASLDTGLSRMKTSTPQDRASLDGARMGKSSMPATSSPLTTPNEEDVRGMADILPQVERGVLRAYLGRYGEQMQAIGCVRLTEGALDVNRDSVLIRRRAYLEDENTGRVMRV